MYYEEQIIDGKLYFRTTPTGNWLLIDYQKPLDRLIECQNELAQLKSNQESEVIENDDHDTEKYQIIFIHLSDGRRLAATDRSFARRATNCIYCLSLKLLSRAKCRRVIVGLQYQE